MGDENYARFHLPQIMKLQIRRLSGRWQGVRSATRSFRLVAAAPFSH